jgi:hypothetical protein
MVEIEQLVAEVLAEIRRQRVPRMDGITPIIRATKIVIRGKYAAEEVYNALVQKKELFGVGEIGKSNGEIIVTFPKEREYKIDLDGLGNEKIINSSYL